MASFNPPASLRLPTAAQVRAARALLDWTQTRLAEEAHCARKTIADFELSRRRLHGRTIRDIEAALVRAGVAFGPNDTVILVKDAAAPRVGTPAFDERSRHSEARSD